MIQNKLQDFHMPNSWSPWLAKEHTDSIPFRRFIISKKQYLDYIRRSTLSINFNMAHLQNKWTTACQANEKIFYQTFICKAADKAQQNLNYPFKTSYIVKIIKKKFTNNILTRTNQENARKRNIKEAPSKAHLISSKWMTNLSQKEDAN